MDEQLNINQSIIIMRDDNLTLFLETYILSSRRIGLLSAINNNKFEHLLTGQSFRYSMFNVAGRVKI